MAASAEELYIAGVQVLSPGLAEGDEPIGGFTYVYARAASPGEAEERIRAALQRDRYEIVAFGTVERYRDLPFPSPEERAEHQRYAEQAESTGEVICASFCTWRPEES